MITIIWMAMVFNKLNLTVGETVVLDKGFRNSSAVVVVALSKPFGMFSTVRAVHDPLQEGWDVMTNRLTKKV